MNQREGRIKLIDFGFSHFVVPGQPLEVYFFFFVFQIVPFSTTLSPCTVLFLFLVVNLFLFFKVLGGTLQYSPPDDDLMTFSFDDWACGVILYAMLTCNLPFSAELLLAKVDMTLNVPSFVTDGNTFV